MLDKLCRRIKEGDNFAFKELLSLKEIKLLLNRLTGYCSYATGVNPKTTSSEVLLQLYMTIKEKYPDEVLEDSKVLGFLFVNSAFRTKDSLFEIELDKERFQKDGSRQLGYKISLSDEELDNIPDNQEKSMTDNIITDIMENMNLSDKEKLVLVLSWDLNEPPLPRERGRWSIDQISKVINENPKSTKQILREVMGKVEEHVQTKFSLDIYRAREDNRGFKNSDRSFQDKQ